ncbi:unnamed protein product [Strongylus vulgaris]|uniref:Uncharacterized protein n=1 Tax=Strongylus vulgaris TaxID=40348 RepID=A0A3P7JVV8_STRVU|nr:unnamed protein product [Strongylus vulgaris]
MNELTKKAPRKSDQFCLLIEGEPAKYAWDQTEN